jgi:hypothetical protein
LLLGHGHDVTIDIPAPGFARWPAMAAGLCLGIWFTLLPLGALAFVMLAFVFAPSPRPDPLGILILPAAPLPFLLMGLFFLRGALHFASRRFTLRVREGVLWVQMRTLFGEVERRWPRPEIAGIRVVNVGGRATLSIEPVTGPCHVLKNNYSGFNAHIASPAEWAWVAAVLRQALADSAGEEAVPPAPPPNAGQAGVTQSTHVRP